MASLHSTIVLGNTNKETRAALLLFMEHNCFRLCAGDQNDFQGSTQRKALRIHWSRFHNKAGRSGPWLTVVVYSCKRCKITSVQDCLKFLF